MNFGNKYLIEGIHRPLDIKLQRHRERDGWLRSSGNAMIFSSLHPLDDNDVQEDLVSLGVKFRAKRSFANLRLNQLYP